MATRSTPTASSSPAPRRRPAAPRPAASGDTLARPGPRAAEAERVARRTSTTQTVHAMVVEDLLARHAPGVAPREALRQLQTLVQGASPDEAKALRRTLFAPAEAPAPSKGIDPDLELSAHWREGAYPYRNLLSRKRYERQKYRLQVELLKLQAWVKETGQRVVILFEGRDAAGKGGAIKRFMEHLIPICVQ